MLNTEEVLRALQQASQAQQTGSTPESLRWMQYACDLLCGEDESEILSLLGRLPASDLRRLAPWLDSVARSLCSRSFEEGLLALGRAAGDPLLSATLESCVAGSFCPACPAGPAPDAAALARGYLAARAGLAGSGWRARLRFEDWLDRARDAELLDLAGRFDGGQLEAMCPCLTEAAARVGSEPLFRLLLQKAGRNHPDLSAAVRAARLRGRAWPATGPRCAAARAATPDPIALAQKGCRGTGRGSLFLCHSAPRGGRAHSSSVRVTAMFSSSRLLGSTVLGHWLISSLAFCTLGNAMTSRMLSFCSSSMTRRSRPKAMPPWGGAP